MKLFGKMKAKRLEKAVERYPDIADNYIQLAALHREVGELEPALHLLRTALDRQLDAKTRAEVILSMAEMQLERQRGDLVSELLEQVAEVDIPAHLRGRINLMRGRLQAAALPDDVAAADAAMGDVLQLLHRAVSEVRADEDRWSGLRELLKLYERRGDDRMIREQLEGLLRLSATFKGAEWPGEEIELRLAEVAERMGESEEAFRRYQRVADSDRLDDARAADVYERMGALRRKADDPIGAIERYEMALRYHGGHAQAKVAAIRYALALLYEDSGRTLQAFNEIERAAKIPNLDAKLDYEINSWLAGYHESTGDAVAALRCADQAMILAPAEADRLDALERRGRLYQATGRKQEAIVDYEHFIAKASPMRAAGVNALLAVLYYDIGNKDKAFQYAASAVQLRPDARILLILGVIHWERGEVIEALRHLLRICDEFRVADERPEAMKLLRAIRQEVRGGEGRKHYHISESELEELDQLLDAAGEETDIIRRLRKGLAKTQLNLVGSIERLLSGRSEIDDDLLDELSDVLLLADLGVDTTTRVLDAIRARVDSRELRDPMKIKRLIRDQIEELLSRHTGGLNVTGAAPYVIMMVGVNGVGKTTTIAKLAKRLKDEGKQVLLAAGDTFRAGAIEQLEVWGERVACEVIKQSAGSDPSAVAYDAVTAAEARHAECLIVDTAGRLHTKVNLMEELKKVRRVIDKKLPGAPHEILLVVDATTGQNAVNQAKLFHEAVGVTGVVLTKMDGTAKGGIIVRIVNELNIPVKFIGIGEGMDDLRPFDPADFVTALFG